MKEMVIEMDLERYFQKSELIPAIVVEKKKQRSSDACLYE